ncbi:MAG: putative protein of unknown function zinc metallopeptidase [Candidatus Saccharibacteria bacterium]|nr:putative protein of unknown function zinc metallopeptidase [Candidatus Saccharibacteria bacterium]
MQAKPGLHSRVLAFLVVLFTLALVACSSTATPTRNDPPVPDPDPVVTDQTDPLPKEPVDETPDLPRVEPGEYLQQGAVPPGSQVTGNSDTYTVESYLKAVVKNLDDAWVPWFVENGYAEPQVTYSVVLPGEKWQSVCTDQKGAPEVVTDTTPNAYYCPFDDSGSGSIWLPATTFQKMWNGDVLGRQSQQAGDFAAAIVTAHEFGHHVKHELEVQEKARGANIPPVTGKNKELLADCFAGVWAATAYYNGLLEGTDFEEAVAAMAAVGDAKPGGKDPHGSPEERVAALNLGYNDQMDPVRCISTYWK